MNSMPDIIQQQISYSTAEIAQAEFYGGARDPYALQLTVETSPAVLPGVYRVIDNELFRVAPLPPSSMQQSER